MKALTSKEIQKRTRDLTSWELNKKGNKLTLLHPCSSYIAGLSFAAKIAVHAEILNRHPIIELGRDSVTVLLTTDAAGGLTADDFELAKRIERLTAP